MAKELIKGTPWYIHAAMLVSFTLLVVGFILPPQGSIDPTTLTGVGEMMGGTALLTFVVNIPIYLEAGVKAKISHGNTTIAVAADEVDEEAEDL